MEAFVDMTPRLRIPSSLRRRQRSLSPSFSLGFFSSPWNVSLWYLPTLVKTKSTPFSYFSLSPTPFIFCHMYRHTNLNDLWQSPKTLPACPLEGKKINAFVLTPPCLRRATHGCSERRSTPPQPDVALPLMPSGHFARHTLALLPWSPVSSSGVIQTHDLWKDKAKFSDKKEFINQAKRNKPFQEIYYTVIICQGSKLFLYGFKRCIKNKCLNPTIYLNLCTLN